MMIGGLRIRSLIFFLFLLVRSSSQVAPDPNMALPDCPKTCGGVTVPYPFGLTPTCSYQNSPGFQLSCKSTSGRDPPQLMWGNLPVVDIKAQQGEMTLFLFISYSCYRSGGIQLQDDTYTNKYSFLQNSPFTISPKNKLTTIGCDTQGFLTGSWGKEFTSGCASYCQNRSSSDEANSTLCDGVGCCQTAVPRGTRQAEITVSSFQKYANLLLPDNDLACGYAFLVREDNFTFDPSYLIRDDFLKRSRSTQVLVEWAIGGPKDTCDGNMANRCPAQNSHCVNFKAATGYQCKCKDGFRGNPYLLDGCADIDECRELHPNPCGSDPDYAFCNNTIGNYNCVCASDGKTQINITGGNGGAKCPDSSIPLYQRVIGACVSVAFLLLGVGRLCYRYKIAFANKTTNFSRNGGLKLQQKIKSLDKDGSNTGDLIRFKERKLRKSIDKGNIVSDPKDAHMGKVYKGRLRNEKDVVIKEVHLEEKEEKDVDEFVDRVVDLYKTRNHNILQLLGYCFETKAPLLLYKFSPIRWRATDNDVNSLLEIAEKTADWFVNWFVKFPPPVIAVRLTTIVQETMDFPLTEDLKKMTADTSDVFCYGVVMAALFTGLEKPWQSSKKTVNHHDLITTHCISLLNKALIHDQKPREGDAGSRIVDSTYRVQELIVELVKRCFQEDKLTMEQVLGELRNIKGNCC